MTAQERYDFLMETVPTGIQVVTNDILAAFGTSTDGLNASRLVLGTFKAGAEQDPILSAAYDAFVTVGISLSDDLRQGMIDQLAVAGSWPNSVRDAVKRLGRIPRWTTAGYQAEPTLSQITTEVRKQELEDEATDRLQAFREALSSWDGSGEEPVL
jgi:hypothetical protein